MAVVALIYGFWCGLLPAIGMGAFWVGQQCTVFLLIAGAYAGGLGQALGRDVAGAGRRRRADRVFRRRAGDRRRPAPRAQPDRAAARFSRRPAAARSAGAAALGAVRLRAALCAARWSPSVAIERLLAIPNGYWVAMTALLLMRPDFQDTLARCLGRVGGTIVGAAGASALEPFHRARAGHARGAGRCCSRSSPTAPCASTSSCSRSASRAT